MQKYCLIQTKDKCDNVDEDFDEVIRKIDEREVYENYKRDLKGKRVLKVPPYIGWSL